MSISNSHSGKPPPDYMEVLYWKISEKASRLVMMNLLSIPLALVFGIGFFIFVRMFGKPPGFIFDNINQDLILVIGVIVVVVLHEFAHGIAMQVFGAQARYGFMWKGLMFFATADGFAFKRDQYIVICLAPLAGLSILACCGVLLQAGTSMVWLLAIWATINGSAAIGDLWIMTVALRYPSSAYIVDERDGMRVFLPPPQT